ncbi:MAG: NAD-glutamate dehydrogenase, partial [SAR324 cluster bacterium]|nr:NAD-glutamate dehydrogenase [SAR324 cluster bacterium]
MSKKDKNEPAAIEAENLLSELLALLNKTPDSELGVAESYFAERLFAKAPSSFFSSYTSEELARVAREGFLALKDFVKGSSSIAVKKDPDSSRAAYFSFTEDCPFIISSTIECIRALNLSVEVIFHPIIPCGSKQIAVTYILLDEDKDGVPKTFEGNLKEVLEDVRLATSSFDKMRAQCQGIKKSLLEPKKTGDNEENLELAAFVEWLEMGSFLMLGTASWSVEGESKVASKPTELHGVSKSKSPYLPQLMEELREDAQNLLQAKQQIWLSRLRIRSLVQRRARMHSVVIAVPEGGKKKLYCLIGLFTYAAHAGT